MLWQYQPGSTPPTRSVHLIINEAIDVEAQKILGRSIDWIKVFNRVTTYFKPYQLHWSTFMYQQLSHLITELHVTWSAPTKAPKGTHGATPRSAILLQKDDYIKYVSFVWVNNIITTEPANVEDLIGDAIPHEIVHWFGDPGHIDEKYPTKGCHYLMAPKLAVGPKAMDNISHANLLKVLGPAR